MTIDTISDLTKDALFLILQVSLPVLLVSLIIGLVISIFQTVTSIQEQTLTFIPKIVCVFLAIMLFGPWMMNSMVDFTVDLWANFSRYVNQR